MFSKIWDAETVVAAIRGEILAGHDISYYATYKRVPSLLKAGERTFGSWRNAIEAVGLNYDDIKKYRTWSEERVIATIRAHVDEGHDLSWRNVALNLDPSLAAAAINYFNDWHHALTEAGLNPEQIAKYQRWSLEKIEKEINLRNENGSEVSYAAFSEDNSSLINATYRRVESFAKFRNSVVGKPLKKKKKNINVDKPEKLSVPKASTPEPRKSWNAENVLCEIKQRVLENKLLSYVEVKKDNCALLRAGERYYGKWEHAVNKAGYDYDTIRLLKHWNNEKVIDKIQYWKEYEENLNYTYIYQKLDSKLAAAAIKKTRFRSWDNALIAAGVDPETTKCRKDWTLGKVMLRLSILLEDGIDLKSEKIKEYAPDLLAAVYYYVGSLKEARKMLEELNITAIKKDINPTSMIKEDDVILTEKENKYSKDGLLVK